MYYLFHLTRPALEQTPAEQGNPGTEKIGQDLKEEVSFMRNRPWWLKMNSARLKV